jgi:hypothetical protein
MGRPKGARNRLTVERDQSAQSLVKRYGCPLEDLFKLRAYWKDECDRLIGIPHGRQNRRKLAKAEMMCRQYDIDILPYTNSKYATISHTSETKHTMVISAPKTASTTREWQDRYAPKDVSPEVIRITDGENYKLIP